MKITGFSDWEITYECDNCGQTYCIQVNAMNIISAITKAMEQVVNQFCPYCGERDKEIIRAFEAGWRGTHTPYGISTP